MGAFLFLLFLCSALPSPAHGAAEVPVGVVLDMGSSVGMMCQTALSMAVEDFYAAHSNYSTRMVLHTRDSGSDAVGAAAAALDLLKNVKVEAIMGPVRSSQASFVITIGNKTQVPIVSFSATSPSLSPTQTPYFVRTSVNDMYQASAISSLIKAFGWRMVVPIYEDTEYGTGFLPPLIDAFQGVDARVPHRIVIAPFASDNDITLELYKLMTLQTRVFVVHMLPPLGYRLLLKAKELGMMSEGYIWIITSGLSDILSSLDRHIIDSIQGVVGVKSYVPKTEALDDFVKRWRVRFMQEYPDAESGNISIFGLWAYDTAWAIAMALETAGVKISSFRRTNILGNSTDLAALEISQKGPALLQSILHTKFGGISGEFHLVDGQLLPYGIEIINVIGSGWREVGFWAQEHGLSPVFSHKSNISADKKYLKTIIWPGDSYIVPRGWEIPTNGKKLKVGVPVKGGFSEFVDTSKSEVTGYCIDVFKAVIRALPYYVPYEFIPYNLSQHPGSYNDLVDQVVFQKFDAVVGDVTIIANRSLYIDFTLPYTESGVAMVVPIRENFDNNAWIFLKPLTTELWLGSLAFFFFTGFIIWVIEHRINNEFRGPPSQQIGTIFYFAFSTLVFAHRERVQSNLSRLVVIIWVFVVLILTSSYTASLTSIMTVERLQPSVTNLNELLKNGHNVGYQDGSFVLQLLKDLNFDKSKLKNYSSTDEYAEALSIGSPNGGVSAIIDEIPYIRLFLANRCSEYTMIGPIHKTDGFGFVFPKNSPLVADISRAILNVTQGKTMQGIEGNFFQTSCPAESGSINPTNNRLMFRSFWGLFLMTGVVSLCALAIYLLKFFHENSGQLKEAMASESSVWRKVVASARYYNRKTDMSHTFRKDDEDLSASEHDDMSIRTAVDAPSPQSSRDGSQSPFRISDRSANDFVSVEVRPSIEPAATTTAWQPHSDTR